MPRFFIDLHDGSNFVKDTEGFDLPDHAAAQERAIRIMAKIAQGFPGTAEREDYLAAIRDADGRVVMRVHLSLDVERIETA
ncbi:MULTISPECIES: hypothetical protein [Methylobacterium]|uniref:DUF6894 domain-containing protein n=1 Tax=Methylobacterium jeotgali TaxID=381630 RepID=A0ABQ4STP2_9HYPH|nr:MULTISPECIES: hypothetical protein [Methylobacterium]PIU05777.1 MAG: hypothetical protein COT56_13475 [Methylobacterium sp. CG09_land_8_20_14_0_10_71_15]PIU15318.1 MAG: hypothetical protein COT28_05185 [Methylobacterium sp. CG08_land_8_20_14_0_20_71_15]GBU18870.1 hypothetical protein AwMethylo_30850 [Methylobacterium sp.]GJE06477.1 hypothetical protein AOPFMNJM_1797 [Methylobacterium jeotgali]